MNRTVIAAFALVVVAAVVVSSCSGDEQRLAVADLEIPHSERIDRTVETFRSYDGWEQVTQKYVPADDTTFEELLVHARLAINEHGWDMGPTSFFDKRGGDSISLQHVRHGMQEYISVSLVNP